ncbi:major facilitator superfamily domain-containing protein [Schizophyllum fasciatum]
MHTAARAPTSPAPATEHTPLLEAQAPPLPPPTPLPHTQLAALCLVRLVDPLNFTQIFPYINEFITFLRLTDDPGKTGFYSGLVESSFALAQLVSIYPTARLSDVIGRRPIILAGALGIALSTMLFGCSQSLAGLLLSRSLAGIFSGNAGVLHSALAEMTDASNRATAVPIYGMTWPVGSIAGPMIGGALANAAQKYPALVGYAPLHAFVARYPYFLPCFVTGALGLLGFVLGWCSLEETLPAKRKAHLDRCDAPPPARPGPDSGWDAPPRARPGWDAARAPSTRALLQLPAVRALGVSGFVLSFICTAFDVMFVLFCYSSVEHGGIGFSDAEIGLALAAAGAYAAFMQLCAMPLILRRADLAAAYRCSMALWPAVFALFPLVAGVARAGAGYGAGAVGWGEVVAGYGEVAAGYDPMATAHDPTATAPDPTAPAHTRALLWALVLLQLGLAKAATLAYTFSMLLCAAHAPGPAALGAVNGLVQLGMCVARAGGPAVVSLIFAVSLDRNILGGQFWVVVMVALSVGGWAMTRGMPGGDAPGRARTTPVMVGE